jgi:outer membrane protein TolC
VARRSLALEEARLAEVRAAHEAGRAPLRELLDAEGARASARMDEIRARHGVRLAAARLLEAVGYWVSWR